MSTILEALKKSEQERRLNNVPTLSDMPAPHEPSRWPMIILSVGLLVLLVFMFFVVKKVWFDSQENAVASPTQSAPLANYDSESTAVVPPDDAEGREALIVNVVSYSQDPAKRFAMINSTFFREGEFVDAGVKVEEVRQNEVVLNVRGEKVIRRP